MTNSIAQALNLVSKAQSTQAFQPSFEEQMLSIPTINEETVKQVHNEMGSVKVDQLNTNALSSTITATLFHKLNDPRKSVLLACCIVDAVSLAEGMDMPEMFLELVLGGLGKASLRAEWIEDGNKVNVSHEQAFDTKEVADVMLDLDYLNEDGTIGASLVDCFDKRTEAYAPIAEGADFTRKFKLDIEKGMGSKLGTESILVQERSLFTVDQYMVDVANLVQTKLGGADKDKEAYVLAGCNKMSASQAYHNEFKPDRRGRTYQATCHGPNGQASDRSRALMDLSGVTTDYDIPMVKKAIRAEVMDMISCDEKQVGKLMVIAVKNPVDFIIGELAKKKADRDVAKPWSFVKAAKIWIALNNGKRPYIGMAVGLDAKCSGPQYGALMAGDPLMASACGVSMTLAERDAYERAIDVLQEGALVGFTRGGVKKAFMGVFYGQGWRAFTDSAQLKADEQFEIIEILGDVMGNVSDARAKQFHKAITDSFGSAMCNLRKRFREFDGRIDGRVGHFMPDGSRVQMNYKIQINIMGVAIEHGTLCPDVIVVTENATYKFIKFALNTRSVHTGDFIRNGFVNMIQATDALIAKLICVHLGRLGAQHVIAVHDCFRVNVTEMHLLEQAIKNAYNDLFGSKLNNKTTDLPMGTDILGLYFEGANACLAEGEAPVVPVKQFVELAGKELRKMSSVNKVPLTKIFDALGESIYFAK